MTDSFNALRAINPVELRVGAVFEVDTAKHIHRSLSDIARLIRDMSAKYLRWPASDQRIFDVRLLRRTAAPSNIRVDEPFLCSFVELHIPIPIWHALTRYNDWVEPVLVSEWICLIEGYAGNRIADVRRLAEAMLVWADPERDTRFVRAAVARIRAEGKPIYCV